MATRREVTMGMLAAAFGATLPRGVFAGEGTMQGNCMTIVYPTGPGLKFDADYYRDHHLKTIMKLYGSSIQRFELRKVAAPKAAYAAAVNIWIRDLTVFRANNDKHGKTLQDDVPNFTNARPLIQFDRLYGETGAGRDVPKLGDACLTILYPNSDSVRWDVDYYKRAHMPLIMKLYGEKAIKRFELRRGEAGMAPDSKPDFIGTVNIYINDQAAFDAAGKQHTKTLADDVPHFSSVMPTAFPTTIYGIG
jgi:uncharacterized protein (TIGR02118 family)